MFGVGKSGTFKPKYGKSNYPSSSSSSSSFLPLPATFHQINRKKRLPLILIILLFIWYICFNSFLSPFPYLFSKSITKKNYPRAHPLTSTQFIETSSKYIYPPIEHAPLLKQLTTRKLFIEHTFKENGIDKTGIKSLNFLDDPHENLQKIKEKEENDNSPLNAAKNYFKNQDKIVFKPKKSSSSSNKYPEIVIVTAVDFNKYSLDGLTKIVQNRVDYAHLQNYGVYVRWSEEFLPILNNFQYLDDKERIKWIRVYCMKAAMFAFPKTKWFWYLDQDGLIMNMNINIYDYILNPEILNSIMLRDLPLIPPDGIIKTYKNAQANSIRFLLIQSNQKIETNSFLMKNDFIGKSMIDIWGDNLYFQYPNFPYGPDSALTHILQWHPFILSKTTIIPAKTIGSSHNFNDNSPKNLIYEDGDFVAQWSNCKNPTDCENILNIYYKKLKKDLKT
ncbi:alpha-1,6-mannosyltransferase, putative [Candida dubliniensis CD36]|uniref:Alpha-1,6-mannosyltransferase, putative n=1 Tax=Candida dubliniensis (strain CD36 / ATCC MYA-646 / CBS 7987 / NCPF 3949 / NRRL Y-17841) TaxID=573826 RepID=B9W726_CANDC|nr:alpha-1,6-mannosyltransferase, putative [Candida dubliniensis CD36]CAX44484.1 alpha-1,6-mannosyltransferase, putative [Candida dubliniensis CD36]